MAEAVKMGWMLFLLLLLFISDARQMPGQDMLGEYMMEHNIPKEKPSSADEIKPLLRADAATPAGSNEIEKAFNWGLWALLVLFSTGGLGFACTCCFRHSTVPASSSAPPPTTNLTIIGTVNAFNPSVHPVN